MLQINAEAGRRLSLVDHRLVTLNSGNVGMLAVDGRGWCIVDAQSHGNLASWLERISKGSPVDRTASESLQGLWDSGLLVIDEERNPSSVSVVTNQVNTLLIKLTGACNYGCTYCYDYDRQRFRSRPSSPRIRGLIEELLSKQEFLNIIFHGGEPLLEFQLLIDLVDFTQSVAQDASRVRFSIQTNGSLLTSEIVQFLERHRFSVGLSIDGLSEHANRHRLAPRGLGPVDVFRSIIDTYPSFVRRQCGFLAVISRTSLQEMEDLICELQDFGVENFSLSFLNKSGRGSVLDSETLTPDEGVDVYQKLFSAIRRGVISDIRVGNVVSYIDNLFSFQPRDFCNKGPCAAGGEFLVMDADGKLRSCDIHYHPYFELTDASGTVADAQSSRGRSRISNRHAWLKDNGPSCRRCPFFGLCGGTCVAKAIANKGIAKAVDPLSCAVTRYIYGELFNEFDQLGSEGPLIGYYLRHRNSQKRGDGWTEPLVS